MAEHSGFISRKYYCIHKAIGVCIYNKSFSHWLHNAISVDKWNLNSTVCVCVYLLMCHPFICRMPITNEHVHVHTWSTAYMPASLLLSDAHCTWISGPHKHRQYHRRSNRRTRIICKGSCLANGMDEQYAPCLSRLSVGVHINVWRCEYESAQRKKIFSFNDLYLIHTIQTLTVNRYYSSIKNKYTWACVCVAVISVCVCVCVVGMATQQRR